MVSQYYPPEAGATQNRLGTFSDGLADRGHEVSVICEQPCHPAGIFHPGFGRRPLVTERLPGKTVQRVWVAASPKKSKSRRLAFYGSFALGAGALTAAGRTHDVMFASSPPLPGVLTAAAAARARGLPLVVDVRDVWPAAAEALGELSDGSVMRVFERAEKWLYGSAARVTATTLPFCRHIDAVAGHAVSAHVPNGALDELLELEDPGPPADGVFRVGYAGNFGVAQGLGIALDAAERLRGESFSFELVGAGPLDAELRQEASRRGLDAVEFRPPIPVTEVGAFLQRCDALLVPLRDHVLFGDFIPSKLYDSMAVGRPAIVAARGEAATLVTESGAGVVVPPEDGEALAVAVRALSADTRRCRALGVAGRKAAGALARSRQIARLEGILEDAAGCRAAPGP